MTVINYNNNNNWTVPSDCKFVDVECWGGGGGGGANNRSGNNAGSGGGGGAYAKTLGIAVTPGQVISMVVGGGGAGGNNNNNGANGTNTSFNNNQVKAAGGVFGRTNGATAGVGGTTANSTGNTKFAGGAGAIKNANGAGGGGGAGAGNNNTGNSAVAASSPGGVGQQGGGSGGAGGASNANGTAGTAPGGGGGGAGNNVATTIKGGGAGAAGLIILTYTPTLISNHVEAVSQSGTLNGVGNLTSAHTANITQTGFVDDPSLHTYGAHVVGGSTSVNLPIPLYSTGHTVVGGWYRVSTGAAFDLGLYLGNGALYVRNGNAWVYGVISGGVWSSSNVQVPSLGFSTAPTGDLFDTSAVWVYIVIDRSTAGQTVWFARAGDKQLSRLIDTTAQTDNETTLIIGEAPFVDAYEKGRQRC